MVGCGANYKEGAESVKPARSGLGFGVGPWGRPANEKLERGSGRLRLGLDQRAIQEVGDIQLMRPALEVFAVQLSGADLEDSQDVAPLAVRDLSAVAAPPCLCPRTVAT